MKEATAHPQLSFLLPTFQSGVHNEAEDELSKLVDVVFN